MRTFLILSVLALPLYACAKDTDQIKDQSSEQIQPAQTSSQNGLDAGWAKTATAKILERDYRDFLTLMPGLYDNQEQVYFEDNLDVAEHMRHARQTYTLSVTPGVQIDIPESRLRFQTATLTFKDSKGRIETASIYPSTDSIRLRFKTCTFDMRRENAHFSGIGNGKCAGQTLSVSAQAISLPTKISGLSQGLFRRARPFKCWVSPQKEDGSYGFYNDIMIHDQGGRAWITGDDHPRVGIKMRNVVWPNGRNRPSLVLYTYRGEDADKAVSYTWTGPESDRLAINLRWIQVSCTLGDMTIQPGINLKTGSGQ